MRTIIVYGDSYPVLFSIKGGTLDLQTAEKDPAMWDPKQTLLLPLRVGSDYIHAVLKFRLHEKQRAHLYHAIGPSCHDETSYQMLFHLLPRVSDRSAGIEDIEHPHGKRLPLLELAADDEPLYMPCSKAVRLKRSMRKKFKQKLPGSVIVHSLPEWPSRKILDRKPKASSAAKGPACAVHVQIGLLDDHRGREQLATPSDAHIIVAGLDHLCGKTRVRKSLSYEAIIADVLRYWRGCEKNPAFAPEFTALSGIRSRQEGDPNICGPKCTYIIVRISFAAAMIYRYEAGATDAEREKAWLLFHTEHPAPIDDTRFGQMLGFTGFIGPFIAAEASTHKKMAEDKEWLFGAVRDAISFQVAKAKRGLFHLFFERKEKGWVPVRSAEWPDETPSPSRYCSDLNRWRDIDDPNHENVISIPINIAAASSYRTQWFLAMSVLDGVTKEAPPKDAIEEQFKKIAEQWLTDPNKKPEKKIPIVRIGNLSLMDRREVEDYLAIRDAFQHYGDGESARPLSIAVFGPPGAGKSFGVKEVTAFMASRNPKFNKETSGFNVSQFTGLPDLVTALHQVRSACLRGAIPVVFMDEFDSAFEGRPFGWLKYFLAPMQDGEFTDGATNYKLGRCVLVFAGGVNRSFEELNGRLRNPSFVDAKGPDFISRLRAHLNIRGINKPEDEVDQGRYILRRAIMLRWMLCKRLAFKNGNLPEKLMDPSIAAAFCAVERFKHGARSMEAILDMCDLRPGHPFSPSDLPAKAQLEMQLDASNFLDDLYEHLNKKRTKASAKR